MQLYYKIDIITPMIYIICALSAEARLFLDHYKLKQYTSLPFKVYENEDVKLIVSNVGYNNALLATTALLAHFPPTKESILLNIGVAAAPSDYSLNSLVVAHKLIYADSSLYPDLLFSHKFEEANLTTVDTPQNSFSNTLVDMEAYAVFQAASRFLQTHQISVVKIISDHFEPEKVSKELILKSFKTNSENIFELIDSMQRVQNSKSIFTPKELKIIELHKNIFTKSQFQKFLDICHFYKLKTKKELQLNIPENITNKKQRGEYLTNVIKKLSQ